MTRKPSKCVCRHPLIEELILKEEQFYELHCLFMDEIHKGLHSCLHQYADVKCFVTYMQDLVSGKECGKCLVLDWNGRSIRLLLVTLNKLNDICMESKTYQIDEEMLTGTGEQLFDYIAQCLSEFATEQSVNEVENLPMAFTFSFPYYQSSLASGKLIEWNKGFECSDVVDEDVVALLQSAIERRGDMKIEILVILKEIVGTIMCGARKYPNCRMACILGNNGTNACYMEKTINAEVYKGNRSKPYMLINTEWGAFGNSGTLDFIRTDVDEDIDKNSVNPGKQIYEKMISGMYLGEQVRLVIQKFISEGVLFQGKGSEKFYTRYTFPTKYILEIESDHVGCYRNCRKVLLDMAITNGSDQDCANIRYICEVISKRAAFLCGTTLAVLLNKMDEKCVTVAIDGSLFRLHPFFERHMYQKTREMTCKKIHFSFFLTEDGSGRGAALTAAVSQLNPPVIDAAEETEPTDSKTHG